MLQRYSALLPHLPYHSMRHVFATDRLLNPDIPGPSNEGAAMLMNNTVGQWRASYAPNARQATAEAAVTAGFQQYKPAHLQLAKQQAAVARAGDWSEASE